MAQNVQYFMIIVGNAETQTSKHVKISSGDKFTDGNEFNFKNINFWNTSRV